MLPSFLIYSYALLTHSQGGAGAADDEDEE